jgi:iron complex outermembrane receptor protein
VDPAAKQPGTVDESLVVLDPFVVTDAAQKGYTSSEAMSAARFNEKVKNIPQTITVLSEDFLKELGVQDLADVMPMIGAGISAQTRSQDSFSIRGFSVQQIYVDGFRDVAEFGGGEFAHVQQLEIIKGPATNVFGNSKGFGGIINRITKRPRAKPMQQISLTVGSFDNYRGVVDVTGPANKYNTLLYRVIAAYTNTGSYRDLHDLKRYFLAPSITWRPTENTDVTIMAELFRQEHQEDNFVPAVRNDATGLLEIRVPSSRSIDEPWQNSTMEKQSIRMLANHRLNKNIVARLAGFIMFDNNPIQQVEALSVAADRRTITRRAFDLNRWDDYRYLEFNLLGKWKTGFVEHHVTLSSDYYYTFYRSNVRRAPLGNIDLYSPVYSATAPDFYGPESTLSTNTLGTTMITGWGATYQANAWKDRLILVAGIRRDHVTGSRTMEVPPEPYQTIDDGVNNKTSPRYGVVVRPWYPLALYYQYGESFQSNLGGGFRIDGSPLNPATGKSTEFGAKLTVFGDKLQLNVASFEIEVVGQGMRMSAPNNSFFENRGRYKGTGAEVNITYNDNRWTLMAGWVNQDVYQFTDGIKGYARDAVPRNMGQLFVRRKWRVNKYGGLNIGAGVIYMGERPMAEAVKPQMLPDHYRVYLNAGYAIAKGLNISMSISNLLDDDYIVGSNGWLWRPAEPRNIKISLSKTW